MQDLMQDLPKRYKSHVLQHTQHSDTTWSLYLDRCDMPLQAGKEIMLHGPTPHMDRQYSIASGENDDHIRILYRLIPQGQLTPLLTKLKPNDPIQFTGSFGSFLLRDPHHPLTFIATGTGIAPAISFIKTHPQLPLTLLHGVRHTQDLHEQNLFRTHTYHPCISGKNPQNHFPGRVTDKLETLHLNPDHHYYLCGANAMILQARHLLIAQNIPDQHIYSEAYYFW